MSCGRPNCLFIRCDGESGRDFKNKNRDSLGSVSSDIITSESSPPSSATSSLSDTSQEKDVSAYLKRFTERFHGGEKTSDCRQRTSSRTKERPSYIDDYCTDDSASGSFRSSTPNREENCSFCQSFQNERQYFLWRSQYTRSSFCSRCSKGNRDKAYISYWGKPSYEYGSWRKRLREGRNVEIDLTPLIEVLHKIDRMDTSMGKPTYYSVKDGHATTSTKDETYNKTNQSYGYRSENAETFGERKHSWRAQRRFSRPDHSNDITHLCNNEEVNNNHVAYDRSTTILVNTEKNNVTEDVEHGTLPDENTNDGHKHIDNSIETEQTSDDEDEQTSCKSKSHSNDKTFIHTNGNRIQSKLLDSIINADDDDEYISEDIFSNISEESSDYVSPEDGDEVAHDTNNNDISAQEKLESIVEEPVIKDNFLNENMPIEQADMCSSNKNIETNVASVKDIISKMDSISTSRGVSTKKEKRQIRPIEDLAKLNSDHHTHSDGLKNETKSSEINAEVRKEGSLFKTDLACKQESHCNNLLSIPTISYQQDKEILTETEEVSDTCKNNTIGTSEKTDNAKFSPYESTTVLEESDKELSKIDSSVSGQNEYNNIALRTNDDRLRTPTPMKALTPNESDNKSARSGSRPDSSLGRYQPKRRLSRSQRDRRSSLHRVRTAQDDEDDEFMQIQQKISSLGRFSAKKQHVNEETDTNTITIPKSIWNHTIRKAIYGTPNHFVTYSEDDISEGSSSSHETSKEESEKSKIDNPDNGQASEEEPSTSDCDSEETEDEIEENKINRLPHYEKQCGEETVIPEPKTETSLYSAHERKPEPVPLKRTAQPSRKSVDINRNEFNVVRPGRYLRNDDNKTSPTEPGNKRKQSIDLKEIRSRRLQIARSLSNPKITVTQAADNEADKCVALEADDEEVTKLNWRSRGYKYDFYMSRQSRTGTEIIEQYQQTRSNKSSKANSPMSSANSSRRSSVNIRARGSNPKLTLDDTENRSAVKRHSKQNRLNPVDGDSRSESRPESRRQSDQNNESRPGISVDKLKAALERAAICSDRLDKRLEMQLN